jgi:hypothetical protein
VHQSVPCAQSGCHCGCYVSNPQRQHPCNRQLLGLSATESVWLRCCVNMPQRGWATAIDVYCTGLQTCGVARTTTVTHMTTTPRWMASTTTQPNAWDVAVLRTAAPLPGTAFNPSQVRSQPEDGPSFRTHFSLAKPVMCQSVALVGKLHGGSVGPA